MSIAKSENLARLPLSVELAEGEGPPRFLLPSVLPYNSVEPALNAARQVKIGGVDAQHKALVEDAIIEPVRDDKLKAERVALVVYNLLPFIEPAKLVVLFRLPCRILVSTLVDCSLLKASLSRS